MGHFGPDESLLEVLQTKRQRIGHRTGRNNVVDRRAVGLCDLNGQV